MNRYFMSPAQALDKIERALNHAPEVDDALEVLRELIARMTRNGML